MIAFCTETRMLSSPVESWKVSDQNPPPHAMSYLLSQRFM